MIRFHRVLALVTLACTVGTICMAALLAMPSPSAPRGRDEDRSAAAKRFDSVVSAAVSAANGRIYLPLLGKSHPLAVCRGGMGEGEAVEHAQGRVWMLGLWARNGGDGNADVVTAERMTAAEHDERYPQDDTLLEDIFPIAPEWSCYWRVELSGHGWLRAGPPGAQMELNRGLVVFPAEPNADHHLPSTLALWWEDEGTPGAEATGTVDVPTGTATMTGPRPPSSPTATVRAWPTPTP